MPAFPETATNPSLECPTRRTGLESRLNLDGVSQPLITEALVFDRRRKSYETFYNTCCGMSNITFDPGEIEGPVGGGGQLHIFGRWC